MYFLELNFIFKQGILKLDSCWSPSQGERFVISYFAGRFSIYGFGETVSREEHASLVNDQENLVEPFANQLIEYISKYMFY